MKGGPAKLQIPFWTQAHWRRFPHWNRRNIVRILACKLARTTSSCKKSRHKAAVVDGLFHTIGKLQLSRYSNECTRTRTADLASDRRPEAGPDPIRWAHHLVHLKDSPGVYLQM